ncbi:hypothetical protein WJX72_000064 [[Myrmecia] bisecta]|uniref:Protein kinase domain-containing protein n=1 Tax=[Myrmecia] bisecta TaxID=41462 RepID=A0AAW1P9E5_9CHLO
MLAIAEVQGTGAPELAQEAQTLPESVTPDAQPAAPAPQPTPSDRVEPLRPKKSGAYFSSVENRRAEWEKNHRTWQDKHEFAEFDSTTALLYCKYCRQKRQEQTDLEQTVTFDSVMARGSDKIKNQTMKEHARNPQHKNLMAELAQLLPAQPGGFAQSLAAPLQRQSPQMSSDPAIAAAMRCAYQAVVQGGPLAAPTPQDQDQALAEAVMYSHNLKKLRGLSGAVVTDSQLAAAEVNVHKAAGGQGVVLQALQELTDVMEVSKQNSRLRTANSRAVQDDSRLQTLQKEVRGGEQPVGAKPLTQPEGDYPITRAQLYALTHPQLDALAAFYNEQFGQAGTDDVPARRELRFYNLNVITHIPSSLVRGVVHAKGSAASKWLEKVAEYYKMGCGASQMVAPLGLAPEPGSFRGHVKGGGATTHPQTDTRRMRRVASDYSHRSSNIQVFGPTQASWAGAPPPWDEARRLASLDRMQMTRTVGEGHLDDITHCVARLLQVPMANITLITQDTHEFLSSHGMGDAALQSLPRSMSFCAYTLLSSAPELLIAPDLTKDARFCDHSAVTGGMNLRFYAGCPLVLSDGARLGTLCVTDVRTRLDLDSGSFNLLCNFAELAVRQIEAVAESLKLQHRDALRNDLGPTDSAGSSKMFSAGERPGNALKEQATSRSENPGGSSQAVALVDTASDGWLVQYVNSQWTATTGLSCKAAEQRGFLDLCSLDAFTGLMVDRKTAQNKMQSMFSRGAEFRAFANLPLAGEAGVRVVLHFRPALLSPLDSHMVRVAVPASVARVNSANKGRLYFVSIKRVPFALAPNPLLEVVSPTVGTIPGSRGRSISAGDARGGSSAATVATPHTPHRNSLPNPSPTGSSKESATPSGRSRQMLRLEDMNSLNHSGSDFEADFEAELRGKAAVLAEHAGHHMGACCTPCSQRAVPVNEAMGSQHNTAQHSADEPGSGPDVVQAAHNDKQPGMVVPVRLSKRGSMPVHYQAHAQVDVAQQDSASNSLASTTAQPAGGAAGELPAGPPGKAQEEAAAVGSQGEVAPACEGNAVLEAASPTLQQYAVQQDEYEPGDQGGRVTLGQLISRSVRGCSFRGISQDTNELVTVTIVEVPASASWNTDVEGQAALAALLQDLDHPNIVRTLAACTHAVTITGLPQLRRFSERRHLDVGAASRQGQEAVAEAPLLVRSWMLQEWCNRGSLKTASEEGCFRSAAGSEPAMLALLRTAQEVAGALAYLHDRGITHGNLEASSVLLASSADDKHTFTVKVSGFDLLSKADTCPQNSAGTALPVHSLAYLAPELFSSPSKTSLAGDVFAFGVLLWVMYNGKQPWVGRSAKDIQESVVASGRRLEFPDSTPDSFKALSLSCMAADSGRRPTFLDILDRLGVAVAVAETAT